jgi:hypothetical protein
LLGLLEEVGAHPTHGCGEVDEPRDCVGDQMMDFGLEAIRLRHGSALIFE